MKIKDIVPLLAGAFIAILLGFTYTTIAPDNLSVGGGLGTIDQLGQWFFDGTNITQNVANTPVKLTGYESSGDCLVTDASGIVSTSTCGAGGGGSGTVTSVAQTVPTGFTITGSPVTTSGTLAIGYDTGYGAILTASTTNWNNFYNTPSTRISAGNGLAWSGNTLSATSTHAAITLSGTLDYITLVGQDIVRGAIDLATDITGILADDNGGTGQSTYSTGDTLYASGANTLAKRTIGTTGDVLSVVGGVPSWVATSTLGISGGSGSPGGSDTYVQFNDGGAFGGDSGFTFNKTNKTLDVGGATITTSDPVLDLSQTWNSAGVTFTGLKLNATSTASAAASLLMNIQESGSTKFAVGKTGITQALRYTNIGASSAGGLDFPGGYTRLLGYNGKASISVSISTGIPLMLYGLGFGTNYYTPDTYIDRDASGALAQRASTNAQSFRVYNTYTNSSNYERGVFDWQTTSNVLRIGTEAGGTGTVRNIALVGGNVGIGTATPAALLTVGNGDLFQVNSSGAIAALTGISNATGVYDFGGATSLEIPNGASPTVDATGEVAVDTTSDQYIYYGASSKRVLTPFDEKSAFIASTTIDKNGVSFSVGTSTFEMANYSRAVTLDTFYCKTNTGTTTVRFGDGTNWTAVVVCGPGGGTGSSLSNNTFTAREDIQLQVGSAVGTPAKVTVSASFLTTAD